MDALCGGVYIQGLSRRSTEMLEDAEPEGCVREDKKGGVFPKKLVIPLSCVHRLWPWGQGPYKGPFPGIPRRWPLTRGNGQGCGFSHLTAGIPSLTVPEASRPGLLSLPHLASSPVIPLMHLAPF